MAFYIQIHKMGEDESSVQYAFEGDSGRRGMLSFNKLTCEASLVESMPGDEKQHCFTRAAVKIARAWKAGRLPEVMEWAS